MELVRIKVSMVRTTIMAASLTQTSSLSKTEHKPGLAQILIRPIGLQLSKQQTTMGTIPNN
jgi:hypothetical protein